MKYFKMLLLLSLSFILTSCSSVSSLTGNSKETETAAETEPQINHMGDAIQSGKFELTLNSWEVAETVKLSDSIGISGADGTIFVVCSLTAKNTGEQADTPFPFQLYSNDIIVQVHSGEENSYATYLKDHDIDLMSKEIAPGETREGILAFPFEAEAIDGDILTLSFTKGSQKAIFELN